MLLLRYIYLCLCLLIASLSAYSVPMKARGVFNPYDHESFSGMTTETLLKKGSEYLKSAKTEPDSAMMCLSIVVNRYDNNPSYGNAEAAVSALINISYLWRESYYDYARAYTAMLKALKISKENDLTSQLPHIYMGMACVLQYVDIGDSPIDSPPMLFSEALQSAISTNNNTLVQYAIVNLCETALEQGMSDIVRHDLDLIHKYDIGSASNGGDSTLGFEYTKCFLKALEYMQDEDYDSMVGEFDRAVHLSSQMKSTDEKLRLLALKMKINAMKFTQKTDSVPILLNSMLDFSNERKYQEYILYALKGLSDYYASNGNKEASYSYDYRYLHVKDSLQHLNNITRVKDIAFITGLEEAQENVRQVTIKKRQNEIVAICIGIVALMVIIGLAIHIINQKKLYEANVRLYNRLQNDLKQNNLRAGSAIADDNVASEDNEDEIDSETSDNSPAAGISAERAEEIYSKVKDVFESSQEIYSGEFSIRTLAALIGEPYYLVSAAINYCSGSNFKTMLLDYRLREACRRLSDSEAYSNQTMESIALGLGFKSRTYFSNVFKKHTGLSPAVYMKIARMKEDGDQD